MDIYYGTDDFLRSVQDSLRLLRAQDGFDYGSVKKRVRAITECEENARFVGFVIGVFFDDYTPAQRADIGSKGYAALLVRFALYLRFLDEWGEKQTIKFKGQRYKRLARIATKREIACCETLSCEMKHVFRLKRALTQLESEIRPSLR